LSLQVVGALALMAGAIVGALIYRQTTEHVDAAGNRDALFVLNSGDIKTAQKIEVIGSFRSGRSFTGDHLDVYCIQLSRFDLSHASEKYWHEGPEGNRILADALELSVNDARDHGLLLSHNDRSKLQRDASEVHLCRVA